MKLPAAITLLLAVSAMAAQPEPAVPDSITVKVVGTLKTGIVAIGAETTGTTITAKNVTWELDFSKNAPLQMTAEKLNGKKVTVQGSLERRAGIEVQERWIVTVTQLQAAAVESTKGK